MSFRLTYTGTLDVKLAQARQAGSDFITVTNVSAITAGLTAAASSGKKSFTLTFSVSYQPADLRLQGALWDAFKTGCEQGLAAQDIMGNEVTVALNTTDLSNTSVDLKFAF
jgi:hypothetical protein